MGIRRIALGTLVALLLAAPMLSSGVLAQASPCAPGQPDSRPPGQPPGGTGQPASRPPQYPPGQCQLQLSRNTATAGQSLRAAGSGYDPGSQVNIQLSPTGRVLATVTADGRGQFANDITIPGDVSAGQYTVAATGFRNAAPYELTAQLRVTSADAAAGADTNRGGGTLPRTGAFIAGLTALGAALTGAGTLAVLAARRRRSTPSI